MSICIQVLVIEKNGGTYIITNIHKTNWHIYIYINNSHPSLVPSSVPSTAQAWEVWKGYS